MRLLVLSLTVFAIFGSLSPVAAGNTDNAELNYTASCASCHGKSGGGNGPMAATLGARPRKFTDCQQMKGLTDDHILFVIKNGGAASNLSGEMPAWQSVFSDDQIRALLRYVRDFCPETAGASRDRAEASRQR